MADLPPTRPGHRPIFLGRVILGDDPVRPASIVRSGPGPVSRIIPCFVKAAIRSRPDPARSSGSAHRSVHFGLVRSAPGFGLSPRRILFKRILELVEPVLADPIRPHRLPGLSHELVDARLFLP